jgi:hypothetical protein
MTFKPFLPIAFLLLAGPALAADEVPPLSPVQIALFESDHLKNIERPERLEYRFSRATPAGTGNYVDRIALDVRPRPDGSKDLWVDFLSGERHRDFPPLASFHGNPVLMYFLERDVETMRDQTGGAATYFRNRIRRAFLDRAELRRTEFRRDGETMPATVITLAPFRGEERLAVFPGMAEKTYRFVLSETVPGTIYEIVAEIPGRPGEAPRLTEKMTFAAERPCETAEGPCAPPSGR